MQSMETVNPARLYLDLLKKALLNEIYLSMEVAYFYVRDCAEQGVAPDLSAILDVETCFAERFRLAVEARREGRHLDRDLRNIGFSHTMIGRRRLDQLDECIHSVLSDNVPGDFIECGVWRGGATIFMRGVLAAYGISSRKVWVADSFEGLPKPTLPQDARFDLSKERFPQLAVSIEQVGKNFQVYDLLDDQVQFLKGWFKDTLPSAPIERLAVLRLDGDLYESTMDCLSALYDRVSPGGYIIIDDYGILPCCANAVTDFRRARHIDEPIERIDSIGVFWRKSHLF